MDYQYQNSTSLEKYWKNDREFNFDEPKSIESHYNNKLNVGILQRNESPILQLKNFNNWVKSILISRYCQEGSTVLDLAGGKGGDLKKWNQAGISQLVLADIAENSIKHAKKRYIDCGHKFKAEFIHIDCFCREFFDQIPKTLKFDLISCQFAFQYAFETEEKARTTISNISALLKPKKFFICTIPNANWIVKKLEMSGMPSFGNSIFRISFPKVDFSSSLYFGNQYIFHLEDAIESCPEYLVHSPTLIRLFNQVHMKLLFEQNFHEFYASQIKNANHSNLFRKMNCLDSHHTISEDQWEAINIYKIYVFQKQ